MNKKNRTAGEEARGEREETKKTTQQTTAEPRRAAGASGVMREGSRHRDFSRPYPASHVPSEVERVSYRALKKVVDSDLPPEELNQT